MHELLLLLRAFWQWVAGAVFAGTLLLALLIGGCTERETTVAGRITNKQGEPVTWGTVTVVGPDNRTYSGRINPDGSYEVPGVPRGRYRIAVNSPNPAPPRPQPQPERKPSVAPARPSANADQPRAENRRSFGIDPTIPPPAIPAPVNPPSGRWFPIPGKYSNPQSSGLGVDANDRRTSRDIVVE